MKKLNRIIDNLRNNDLHKTILLIILCMSGITAVHSQQLPQFSQRMVDVLLYNPAYAGTKGHPEAILHYRNQWLGFNNSPVTQSISIHGKINRIMGIGAFVMKDQTGPFSNFCMNLSYAHHIDLNKVALVMGIGGTFVRYSVDGSKMTIHEQGDNAIQLNMTDKVWNSDISFGTYLYNEHFYLGLSSLQLLQSKVKIFVNYNKDGLLPLSRHYYATGGYIFSFLQNYTAEPSFLISKTLGNPMELDLNMNVQYLQKFMTGISYRLKDAIIILLGAKINEKYKVAYSYDVVISNLKNYNSGSHELIFTISLPDITNRRSRWHHEYKYDFNPKTNKWRERW
ncbi:MAG: type IX secretion system membrane protein PorP/SprF [Bacteroidia bacterium]|nr:type IX secretion system membrane protein PorP/SprF [Bacteroidia bacterium]